MVRTSDSGSRDSKTNWTNISSLSPPPNSNWNHGIRLITGNSIKEHVSTERLSESSGLPSLNQMSVETILLKTWQSVNYHFFVNLPKTTIEVKKTSDSISSS